MKFFSLFLAIFFSMSFSALQSQTAENNALSLDNQEYVEWVSKSGFRFMGETKSGEATFQASEVLDSDGNAIPENVTPATFDITKYDFETIVAPEKNVIIRVSENKAIFITSKKRQQVLFNRFLTNQNAKK
ncbi:MAG: hypothetical protein AB8B53_08235 [Flavobacteriales bacterium]